MLFLSLVNKCDIIAVLIAVFLMVFSYAVRKPLIKENAELRRELKRLRYIKTNSMYGMSERAKNMKQYFERGKIDE